MDKHVKSRPRIAIMLDEYGVTCVVADTDVEVVAVDKQGEYIELTGKVIEPQVIPLASFRQSSATLSQWFSKVDRSVDADDPLSETARALQQANDIVEYRRR